MTVLTACSISGSGFPNLCAVILTACSLKNGNNSLRPLSVTGPVKIATSGDDKTSESRRLGGFPTQRIVAPNGFSTSLCSTISTVPISEFARLANLSAHFSWAKTFVNPVVDATSRVFSASSSVAVSSIQTNASVSGRCLKMFFSELRPVLSFGFRKNSSSWERVSFSSSIEIFSL